MEQTKKYFDLNRLSAQCYANALKRRKISEHDDDYADAVVGLHDEFQEFVGAFEDEPSKHLPQYTEAAEELADIAIVCFTELHRRGINIERVITDKIIFNENRV